MSNGHKPVNQIKKIKEKHSFRGHFFKKNRSSAMVGDSLGVFDIDGFATQVDQIWNANNHGNFSFEEGIWENTLTHGDGADYITRRLFAVMKHGPLMYRTETGEGGEGAFKSWPYSLATAVSHGGRILIQLPPLPEGADYSKMDVDNCEFMNWFLGGAIDMAKGRTATHGIQDISFRGYKGTTGGQVGKVIAETKGWGSGLGMQHVGLNIALGGENHTSAYGKYWKAEEGTSAAHFARADGRHGHMYIGYLTGDRPYIQWGENPFRGLLVGIEGSSPLLRDVVGHYHGPRGGSSIMKVAGGIKWKYLSILKPGNYDCMFVDMQNYEDKKESMENDTGSIEATYRPIPRPPSADQCIIVKM